MGIDENEIQEELNKIIDTYEECKLLTEEEKRLKTISLEDFKREMNDEEN